MDTKLKVKVDIRSIKFRWVEATQGWWISRDMRGNVGWKLAKNYGLHLRTITNRGKGKKEKKNWTRLKCHTSPLFYVSHQSSSKGNGDFSLPWVTKAWEDSIKWVSNCGLGGSLVKNLYLIFCLWANMLSILSPETKILKHFQISSPLSLPCSLLLPFAWWNAPFTLWVP